MSLKAPLASQPPSIEVIPPVLASVLSKLVKPLSMGVAPSHSSFSQEGELRQSGSSQSESPSKSSSPTMVQSSGSFAGVRVNSSMPLP